MKKDSKTKAPSKRRIKQETYLSHLQQNPGPLSNKILIGIPMTGVVRAEWMLARYGNIIPVNWSSVDVIQWINQHSPVGYMVADARNLVVKKAVEMDAEWLLFIDHDVIIPPYLFLALNDYIRSGKYPVVAGLYYTRGFPSEPLLFRGRGNSYFKDWKLGDKVMVDGIPMGCTLINGKLLKAMWNESEEYYIGREVARRVFETPNKLWFDPQTGSTNAMVGTEDLFWCDRVLNENFLTKAGFPEFQKMKYPFLMDTSLACYHIGIDGVKYPQFELVVPRDATVLRGGS